jgi:hypothetical protein
LVLAKSELPSFLYNDHMLTLMELIWVTETNNLEGKRIFAMLISEMIVGKRWIFFWLEIFNLT